MSYPESGSQRSYVRQIFRYGAPMQAQMQDSKTGQPPNPVHRIPPRRRAHYPALTGEQSRSWCRNLILASLRPTRGSSSDFPSAMTTKLQSFLSHSISAGPLRRPTLPSPPPASGTARAVTASRLQPVNHRAMDGSDAVLRSRSAVKPQATSSFDVSPAAVDTVRLRAPPHAARDDYTCIQVMMLLPLSTHHCFVLLHHSAEFISRWFGSFVVPLVQLQAEDREASSRGGHAFLHDFCMTIPYGMGVGAAGILSLCFRAYTPSLVLLGAATAVEFLAVLSLKRWQQQQGSQLFTAISAGAVPRLIKVTRGISVISHLSGPGQNQVRCSCRLLCRHSPFGQPIISTSTFVVLVTMVGMTVAGSVLTRRVGNAAVAAAVTVVLWSQAPAGRWAAWAVRSAAGVSALMLLFLVYNVAAGGNPSKGEKPAIEQECDVLESSCDK